MGPNVSSRVVGVLSLGQGSQRSVHGTISVIRAVLSHYVTLSRAGFSDTSPYQPHDVTRRMPKKSNPWMRWPWFRYSATRLVLRLMQKPLLGEARRSRSSTGRSAAVSAVRMTWRRAVVSRRRSSPLIHRFNTDGERRGGQPRCAIASTSPPNSRRFNPSRSDSISSRTASRSSAST
jgi:hypothetical protein